MDDRTQKNDDAVVVEDSDDDEEEEGGGLVLARLGGALARANKNDEAAVALLKAMELFDRCRKSNTKDAFEARENFMVVVNRHVCNSMHALGKMQPEPQCGE
jgi:hypothetical protein